MMMRMMMLVAMIVMGTGTAMAWPKDVKPVLSEADSARYKRLFDEARDGKKPLTAVRDSLSDKSLLPDVEAMYMEHGNPTYSELKSWLDNYGDYPQAMALYADARRDRPMPKQTCNTIKIKQKDGTLKRKRTCKTTGTAAPLPDKPLAMVLREQRVRNAEAAREAQYNGMSVSQAAERRRILGQVWRQRQAGNLTNAADALTAPGARDIVGVARWQEELVMTARLMFNLREWQKTVNIAMPATRVSGPIRDEARWLAGFASYRLGDYATAAKQLEALVQEEPANGKFYARAAWWGARAHERLGNRSAAKALLMKGAADEMSFYGQLAGAKTNRQTTRSWATPAMNAAHLEQIKDRPLVKRGMALAQVGEEDLAQQVFRQANEEIPYQMTSSVAAFALQAGLPGTALRAGQTMNEQGEVNWTAMYPDPKQWQPKGGMQMDRGLMLAIMRQESAFQPAVGSRVGAQGLMQLMPATSKYIARLAGRPSPSHRDLHDPAVNMLLAQDYVGYLGNKLDGNIIKLLAAYNAGPGNVNKWKTRGITGDGDPLMYIESIPLHETRDYVQKVMANWWIYQDAMKDRPWALQALAQNNWPVVDVATGQGTQRKVATN